MADILHVVVPGRPVSWQRQATAPRGARRARRPVPEVERYKQAVAYAAQRAMQAAGWLRRGRPVEFFVGLDVYTDTAGGDYDRYLSAVYDGLEGIVYESDRQVAGGLAGRRHVRVPPGEARIEITIERA